MLASATVALERASLSRVGAARLARPWWHCATNEGMDDIFWMNFTAECMNRKHFGY